MDFLQTIDGDIVLTSNDAVRSAIHDFINIRIRNCLRSKPGDWLLYPSAGANIAQYNGYPNIPATKELVEEEVREVLSNDRILSALGLDVIYTPVASDAAVVEIIVTLPDGSQVVVNEFLNSIHGSVIGRTEPIFTEARYNTDDVITRTEVITRYDTGNNFLLKYLPINKVIFLVPFNSSLELTEGTITKNQLSATQTIAVTDSDQVTYTFDGTISDILANKLVQSLYIEIDGTIRTSTYFRANDSFFTLVNLTDDMKPESEIIVHVDYYDSIGISGVSEITQDAGVNNIFPRSRITTKYVMTTVEDFPPGQYLVQYNTYRLEGLNA